MKTKKILYALMILSCLNSGLLFAQDSLTTSKDQQTGPHAHEFIDEDGDGYNDNAPDHDGDGIPNGLDPDYQKLKAKIEQAKKKKYIDLDGDGINDYIAGEDENKVELPKMNQEQQQSGAMDQNTQRGKGNQERGKKSGGKK